jgi:predicted phage baseplate assembly protein
MPLPLPDLDTRLWADLTDEARALIPRYAPTWTDFNIHDPGISIIELLAWQVEQDVYWLNRVPPAHRRAFLELVGVSPLPPQAATALLALAPSAPVDVPASAEFTATAAGQSVLFSTTAALHAIPARLVAIWTQSAATARPIDASRSLREGRVFPAFGDDPQIGAALYLGFDAPLPVGQPVRIGVAFAGGRSDATERQRIANEAAAQAAACVRLVPAKPCGPTSSPVDPPTPPTLQHHSVRIGWAFRNAAGAWQTLDPAAGQVADDTRALTLDGTVVVRLPSNPGTWDAGSGPLFYLRATLDGGDYDAPPLLNALIVNAVPAVQAVRPSSTFTISAGVIAGGPLPIEPGLLALNMTLDANSTITALSTTLDPATPRFLVRFYRPATALATGSLILDLVTIGISDGTPNESFALPRSAVAGDSLALYSYEDATLQPWRIRADFGASGGKDHDATCDPTAATIGFGNGDHGHIPPAGTRVFASYGATAGSAGNLGATHTLTLAPTLHNWLLFDPADFQARAPATTIAADTAWAAISPASYNAAAAQLGSLPPLRMLLVGADAESLNLAAGRAVLGLQQATRAITPADYETLALETPGTAIARVRALPNRVAEYPCLIAPGIVTVIIVPNQHRPQPLPSVGLRDIVYRYLDRRRLVGGHIAVVAPSYVVVQVSAMVKLLPGASRDRVLADVIAALNLFLHPLTGGPAAITAAARSAQSASPPPPAQPRTTPGLIVAATAIQPSATSTALPETAPIPPGWPFGRDVYRSEVLQVISGVAGVDNVLQLSLIGDGSAAQCGNLCVGPTQLVVSGTHTIEAQ